MNRHPLLPTLLLSIFASAPLASAQTEYLWTNNTNGGTKSWKENANWQGNAAPGNPSALEVHFNNNTSSSAYSVLLDIAEASQTLDAGLLINGSTSSTGQVNFNLNGKTLILNGAALTLDPNSGGNNANRTLSTFSNGTVQLGTDDHSAQLILGTTQTAGSVVNNSVISAFFTTTLNTHNTSSILVASNAGNNVNNVVLDLSGATLVSGGTLSALAVSDSIAIGQNQHTGPTGGRHRHGMLKMGVVSHLDIGNDLILGQNLRASNADVSAMSTLQFSTAGDQGTLNLHIGRDLRIGVGPGATGTVSNAPADLRLVIGSEAEPGSVLYVGYKNTATYSGTAQGSFTSAGGTLSAHVTELRVGQNNHASNGAAIGTFNFSASTLGIMEISGDAVVGKGYEAAGILLLNGGTASSLNLTVGESTGTTRSLLGLEETLWSVSNALKIGAKGDITLSQGAQIDLLSSDALDFTISDGGTLKVYFESNDDFWGLRMAGAEHASLFQSYLTSGALILAGAYGSEATIYTYEGYTYLGIQTIPEPGAVALFGLAALGMLAIKRHRY